MSTKNQRRWNRQVRDYLNELEARQIFGGTGGNLPDFSTLTTDGWMRFEAGFVYSSEHLYTKNVIDVDESVTIPTDNQMLIYDGLQVNGELIIEPGGALYVFNDDLPEPLSPDFTYDLSENLTQIDYAGGEQKLFTYNGNGDLQYVDFIQDGTTFRKEFFYTGGLLDYVDEYYI